MLNLEQRKSQPGYKTQDIDKMCANISDLVRVPRDSRTLKDVVIDFLNKDIKKESSESKQLELPF